MSTNLDKQLSYNNRVSHMKPFCRQGNQLQKLNTTYWLETSKIDFLNYIIVMLQNIVYYLIFCKNG